MTYLGTKDFSLEVVRGNVSGVAGVSKFGRNADIDTATDPEDVWSAGSIWVPPTTARIHNIASTSANDTNTSGSGARTVRVWGLTGWGAAEVSEDVNLNGVSNVATSNSYVIIHRMRVLTAGSGAKNDGTITATAVTDATVTAQIFTGYNQTLMAIYGVPSTQTLYLTRWYAAMNRASGTTTSADIQLLMNHDPATDPDLFVVKSFIGLSSAGSSFMERHFDPHFTVSGPAILKVQVEQVSANDTDVSAGFNGFLVDA